MDTLYLDPGSWDLALDSSGNIALASNPYALAQSAATAILTFLGDIYYDQAQGIPYFQQVLNNPPPLALYRAMCVDAAMLVPGVVSAQVFFRAIVGRKLTGQVQVTDAAGTTTVAGF